MQFKLGDIVSLKSGGPTMTVSELTDDGFIVAVWFPTTNDGVDLFPRKYNFEPEMLELTADEDGFYEDLSGEELSSQFQRGDLSDAELDAIIADYERDRAR